MLVILMQLSVAGTGIGVWRHYLVIFPMFVVLAKITSNRRVDDILTIVFWLLQAFLMISWVRGAAIIVLMQLHNAFCRKDFPSGFLFHLNL
jgi:hypothetical protein